MFRMNYLINYGLHRLYSWPVPFQHAFTLQFRDKVLRSGIAPPASIETIRKTCYKNTDTLISQDYGAGSRATPVSRSIGKMARAASVSRRKGTLLYRMAAFYRPAKIIELGTGAGISTLYLASGNPQSTLITVEGNPQLTGVASANFRMLDLPNVTLINKQFDEVIGRLTAEITDNTLIYIDGNHTFEATLRYFEAFGKVPGCSVIIIFDDISWSAGMMQAWKTISCSENTGLAIDLFHMGIVFQGYGIKGQMLRLWFGI